MHGVRLAAESPEQDGWRKDRFPHRREASPAAQLVRQWGLLDRKAHRTCFYSDHIKHGLSQFRLEIIFKSLNLIKELHNEIQDSRIDA
jgi:hypothetical protein